MGIVNKGVTHVSQIVLKSKVVLPGMLTSRLQLHNPKKVRSLINKKNQILKDKNVKKRCENERFFLFILRIQYEYTQIRCEEGARDVNLILFPEITFLISQLGFKIIRSFPKRFFEPNLSIID